jgi:hypothetical protein
MHVTDSAITPASHAEDGEWYAESNSASKPTSGELQTRLSDTPAEPAPAETPVADADPSPSSDPKTDESAVSALLPDRDEATGKFKKTGAERIAELQAQINAETRRKHDARREREQEEAAIARLKAEREALAAKPAVEAKPAADLTKPKWQDFEAKGLSYADYEDARDAWVEARAIAAVDARQKQAEEKAKYEQQTAIERDREARYEARVSAVASKHPDFQQVVSAASVDVPQFVDFVVKDHPQGPELLYALCKQLDLAEATNAFDLPGFGPRLYDALMSSADPVALVAHYVANADELTRISGLPPAAALVALGRLEGSMSGANNGSPAPAPTSHAPKPIQPVGKSRSVAANADDPDDIVKWIALENEKERKALRG